MMVVMALCVPFANIEAKDPVLDQNITNTSFYDFFKDKINVTGCNYDIVYKPGVSNIIGGSFKISYNVQLGINSQVDVTFSIMDLNLSNVEHDSDNNTFYLMYSSFDYMYLCFFDYSDLSVYPSVSNAPLNGTFSFRSTFNTNIYVDPTFGNTNNRPRNYQDISNQVTGSKFKMGVYDTHTYYATADSISAYLRCTASGNPGQNYMFGIYDDSENLIAYTQQGEVSDTGGLSAGFHSLNIVGNIELDSNAYYRLVAWGENNIFYNAIELGYIAYSGKSYQYDSETYDSTLPDPFNTDFNKDNYQVCIYCTYSLHLLPDINISDPDPENNSYPSQNDDGFMTSVYVEHTTFPQANLYEYGINETDTLFKRVGNHGGDWFRWSQVFTVGAVGTDENFNLTHVTLNLSKDPNYDPGTLYVSIHNTTYKNNKYYPYEEENYSNGYFDTSILTDDYSWYNISMRNCTTLYSGVAYALILSCSDAVGENNHIRWAENGTYNYSGGYPFFNTSDIPVGDPAWSYTPALEFTTMHFQIWGVTEGESDFKVNLNYSWFNGVNWLNYDSFDISCNGYYSSIFNTNFSGFDTYMWRVNASDSFNGVYAESWFVFNTSIALTVSNEIPLDLSTIHYYFCNDSFFMNFTVNSSVGCLLNVTVWFNNISVFILNETFNASISFDLYVNYTDILYYDLWYFWSVNVSVNASENIYKNVSYSFYTGNEVYCMSLAFDTSQFGIILNLLLFFFFFYIGYESKKPSGGGLMIIAGLIFIGFEFIVSSFVDPVYVLPLLSPLAGYIILLGIRKQFFFDRIMNFEG